MCLKSQNLTVKAASRREKKETEKVSRENSIDNGHTAENKFGKLEKLRWSDHMDQKEHEESGNWLEKWAGGSPCPSSICSIVLNVKLFTL